MPRLGDDLAVTTSWRLSERGIYRDRAAEHLDRALAGSLRLVDIGRDGQRLLYIDFSRGEYRELRFRDEPDGCAGSATLAPVTVDYVKAHYRPTPAYYVAEA